MDQARAEKMFSLTIMQYVKNNKQIIAIVMAFIAFCCVQAIFFETVTPFFFPLWLVVRERLPAFQQYVAVGGLLGGFLLGFGQGMVVMFQMLVIVAVCYIPYLRSAFYVQLLLVAMAQLLWQMALYGGFPTILTAVAIGYECLFSLMALLLFKQLLPQSMMQRYEWTHDKIVAALVLVAGILAGMKSFVVLYFSMSLIILQFLICVVAFSTSIGTTALFTLAIGFLLGLTNLSFTGMMILYTCSGVVASFMQSYSRILLGAASLMPSVFFFFYDATLPLDSVYFLSALTGVLLFWLLPSRLLQFCRQYYIQQTTTTVPVHRNEAIEQHLQQFQHFALFMKELVFERFTKDTVSQGQKEAFTVCTSCFRYEQCFGETKEMVPVIENWHLAKRSSKAVTWLRAEAQLKNKCIKSSKLLDELNATLQQEQMARQFYHGKKMIALQLRDLTEHLQKLLQHQQQAFALPETEQQLQHYLREHGLTCLHIEWLNDHIGERELICSVADERDAQLLVQQMEQLLYEWLQEPVQGECISERLEPFFYRELKFRSTIRYQLEYDIYTYSHENHLISGDSYRVFPLHKGLTAIMLSDGMGTSYRAQHESERLIQMLQQCLLYNLDPETAMHTMHYVLSLKSDSDMYATMDFALVDLQFGHLWCWKAGGMTTYVLRGDELFKVESTCAPIGFLPDFAIDTEMIKLRADDLILMVSDGLFSESENWLVQEHRLIGAIRERLAKGATIQVALFDCMNYYKQQYAMTDDCTVMLFRLQHVVKPWHVFRPNDNLSSV